MARMARLALTMRSPNAIDFLRGVALLEILVNHVPGNALSRLTHRQYGWSDAAEALIFLAGLALAMRGAGPRGDIRAEWLRAGKIYVWHVLFTFILMTMYFVACLKGDPGILAENGTQRMDASTLAGVFLLTHQLRYFDILPLYVLLALLSPFVLRAAGVGLAGLLTTSCAVYLFARASGIDAPAWPQEGQWYFNLFAWQFLFVLGYVCGRARETCASFLASRLLIGAAVALLAVAALAMHVGLPDQNVATRGALQKALWDKGDLGPMRLLHFLALALVVARLSGPIGAWLARHAAWTWICVSTLGRYSLHTFCAAALLSAIGQIAHRAGFRGVVFDTAFFLTSLCLLLAVVRLARARRLRAPPALCGPGASAPSVLR